MERKDREILDNSFITSIFVSSRNIGWLKNFKTKEEALAAMKKATDRKRTLIEYLKKGYSLEELEKMGFKMAKFA